MSSHNTAKNRSVCGLCPDLDFSLIYHSFFEGIGGERIGASPNS